MPQTSVDSVLRTALHTAIVAAWTGANAPTKIIDDPLFDNLPKTGADVPYAICDVGEISVESQGLKYDEKMYPYSVSGVWDRTDGLNIKDFQQSRINELLAQLTTVNGRLATTPAGIVRDQTLTESYANLFGEPTEDVVTVSVLAELTVIESKS